MTAHQHLRTSDLDATLKRLMQEVRDNPADPKHRIFLFQLFAVLGQWDRALTQLNVLRDMSQETLSMAQTYQETLNCEALRAQVFAGKRTPLIFGEPEQWMAMMLQALQLNAAGSAAEALQVREQALEQAPTTGGKLVLFPTAAEGDDPPAAAECEFAWMADADSCIGPFLEAIINGKYYWIPFQHLASVGLEKVSDLRDLVWLPARFLFNNGGETVGFVPTRYSGSENSPDNMIRMAKTTEWNQIDESTYRGLGVRVLTTDVDEYALTQIARIEFAEGESTESAAAEVQGG